MKSLVICFAIVTAVNANGFADLLMDNSVLKAIARVYGQCNNSGDLVRCLKIQGVKFAGRALKVQSIKLMDGLSIVKNPNYADNQRSFTNTANSNDLQNISSKSLDNLLITRLTNLMESHQVELNIPRLMTYAEHETKNFVEGREKKMKKYLGPFIATVLLKAGILKMAYHSIAIVAGKALIIGKIALIISAIIGLKKLVTPDTQEKTTYEIVKHPHVQQSHTYSSSHGDYEGHEGGSSYHRSIDDEIMMQEKAYSAHVPRS